MILKGELLPNGAGWRCGDCGITVMGDPGDSTPQARHRLCTACVARRRVERKNRAAKTP